MESVKEISNTREGDNELNEFFAGGAKIRLLESSIDFELACLLGAEGSLSAEAIAKKMAPHPLCAGEWLRLLNLIDTLQKIDTVDKPTHGSEAYAMMPLSQSMFGDDSRGGHVTATQWSFGGIGKAVDLSIVT
jgi:hypothetical protein